MGEKNNDTSLHILSGETFRIAFSGRSRKKIGPSEAFRFNLQRMWVSLEAIDRVDPEFRPLIEREKRDIVSRAIRSQYELGWASKAFRRPMYFESNCQWKNADFYNREGMMEHSIPVSILVDKVLQNWPERDDIRSDGCLFASTYYVALMSPVVLLSKETDRKLSVEGFHRRHQDPIHPLSRYAKVGAAILDHAGQRSNNITLDNHIALVKRTPAGSTYLTDMSIAAALGRFASRPDQKA